VIIAEEVEGEALATLVVNRSAHARVRSRQGAGLRRSPQGELEEQSPILSGGG